MLPEYPLEHRPRQAATPPTLQELWNAYLTSQLEEISAAHLQKQVAPDYFQLSTLEFGFATDVIQPPAQRIQKESKRQYTQRANH